MINLIKISLKKLEVKMMTDKRDRTLVCFLDQKKLCRSHGNYSLITKSEIKSEIIKKKMNLS